MRTRRVTLDLLLGGVLGLPLLGACSPDLSPTVPPQAVEEDDKALWTSAWENLGSALPGKPGAAPWIDG